MFVSSFQSFPTNSYENKFISIFEALSKLYFSLNAQVEIQISKVIYC